MQMHLIPEHIDGEEPCVRCILHPMMYSESKQKFRREALLPPPNRNDVSLLRLNYTTIDFCAEHGKSIAKENVHYVGLVSITRNDVLSVNREQKDCVSADIVYGPMHQDKYVLDRPVYVDDPSVDLPMHADLKYNKALEAGEVRTLMRLYADKLMKKIRIISMP